MADQRNGGGAPFEDFSAFDAERIYQVPGVLLDGPNDGFTIATPVGLLVSSLFAGWSALPLPPER